jgi:hypothetical protein
LGAQQGKLDVDLHASALLDTPSVMLDHEYDPFALEDGGRLARMAVELVDRVAILVAIHRFLGIDLRSLRFDNVVRMQHFVPSIYFFLFPFGDFGGMCGENFSNVVLLLFMILWVLIFVMICKRTAPKLWHASLFLGLRPVGVFSSLIFPSWLIWFPLLFRVRNYCIILSLLPPSLFPPFHRLRNAEPTILY